MKKISNQTASIFYVLTGIYFLIAAARDVFAYGELFEWGMFILLVIGVVISMVIKATWIAFYSYVLILFYNPLILAGISGKNSSIADVCIGISYFLIGLHITKLISNNK